MTNTRHPDIEVYIKTSSVTKILDWLAMRCDRITPVKTRGTSHELNVFFGDTAVPVLIEERVVGKAWVSLWFNSDETPWAQDINCAREISQALQTQTRCIVNGWQEGDEPDEWWRVDKGTEEKIIWTTH